MTTTTVKSNAGTVISVFNNGVVALVGYYDSAYRVQKKNVYNDKGVLIEIDTFTYTATNKVDTVSRVDPFGNLIATDYYVNGVFDHTSKTTPVNVDTTAPSLLGLTPADDSKAVAVNSNIVLSFSEAVKAGIGNLSIYNNDGSLAKSIAMADSSQVRFSGNTVTVNPITDLSYSKDYYIQIAANAITDTAGNNYLGISNVSTYNFSTVAASKLVDSIAPKLQAFTTSSGRVASVDVDSNVLITFSETIKLGSGKIYLHSGSATGPIIETFDVVTSSQIIVNGSTLKLDPSNNLAYGSRYYITVDNGAVTDLAGNAYKDIPALTSFSTTSVLTTQPGSWNTTTGYGAIDVLNALSNALGKKLQDVSAPDSISYGLKTAHFDDAWAAGYTGKGQTIAVIDSGIDLNNKDLTAHLSKDSFNFVANNTNVQDDFGHGTFVASEIVAANNGDAITGAAYDAELMVLKATNNLGNATSANVAKAIYYAVDHGADIITVSLSSVLPQPLLKAAFDYAKSHDVLVAVSAGNTAANKPSYPAIYAATNNNVVSVGATSNILGKEYFSAISGKAGSVESYNYVVAVGVGDQGYDQNGNLTKMSGTSMAAPLVAAEMAILKQALEQTGAYVNNVIDDMVMNYVTHDTHSIQLSLLGVSSFTPVDAFYV